MIDVKPKVIDVKEAPEPRRAFVAGDSEKYIRVMLTQSRYSSELSLMVKVLQQFFRELDAERSAAGVVMAAMDFSDVRTPGNIMSPREV